jgi:hypothetical protein
MKKLIILINCILFVTAYTTFNSSCAVIVPPGGGPKDTLPPRLVAALPKDSSLNVTTNKIILSFDEFVEVKDVQQNVIVSPNPKSLPVIDYKLHSVMIKLKDSLEPNTTYSINFGNSIKDVNEGNVAKGLTYTFSTGKYIDSGVFHGQVILAETGKFDSTLIVVLHQNLEDSAIEKNSPRYFARVDAKGNFNFRNLPAGKFKAYVVPDDFTKKYDDSTKMFAFLDSPVVVSASTAAVSFYAYEEQKRKEDSKKNAPPAVATPPKNAKVDKQLKFMVSLDNGKQDLLNKLILQFNRKLKSVVTGKFVLCDTFYRPLENFMFTGDTSATKIILTYNWKEDTKYKLLIAKDAVADTAGITLSKADTISFTTKRESEYGSIKLRFPNVDTTKNPVLILLNGDKISESFVINQKQLSFKLFPPGDYELRVLFDRNKNKKWDTGNFKNKIQPEIVKDLKKKINVKADWDNEFDINF